MSRAAASAAATRISSPGVTGVEQDISWGIIDWRENVSGGKGGSVIIIGTGIGIGSGDRTMDGDIVGRKRGAG